MAPTRYDPRDAKSPGSPEKSLRGLEGPHCETIERTRLSVDLRTDASSSTTKTVRAVSLKMARGYHRRLGSVLRGAARFAVGSDSAGCPMVAIPATV